jgi:hypothetical protein
MQPIILMSLSMLTRLQVRVTADFVCADGPDASAEDAFLERIVLQIPWSRASLIAPLWLPTHHFSLCRCAG